MSDRIKLLAWLGAVVAISFFHHPGVLAALLSGALLAQGRHAAPVLRRALIAVAVVNLAISLAFVVQALLNDQPWVAFVLRLNLRVLLLTVLTLWFAREARLERALDFSPSLTFLLVLVRGQIGVLRTLVADYRQAFASRNPSRPHLNARMFASARAASAVMYKAECQAEALNQGMRSRGFFDDREP